MRTSAVGWPSAGERETSISTGRHPPPPSERVAASPPNAASIADARGATATAIRDMLGHTSLRTTERYLHRSREQSALAMAALMDEPRRGPQRAPTVEGFHDARKKMLTPFFGERTG
jgi:hypothetical protein